MEAKQSKQALAKQAQGYRAAPMNCGTCKHRTSEIKLQDWCARRNEDARRDGEPEPYPLSAYGVERAHSCGIGNFAVKKMAVCDRWEAA